jgi:D-glycero-beta-D-manno-heptose-7-phosphate kinase
MKQVTIESLKGILEKAQGKKIAVIGDVMLDRFFWGHVSRVSPEAPVPVVDVENESFHLGGAANVANNLTALGLKAYLYGIIGNDYSGNKFIEIANELGIDTQGLIRDKQRPTTVKTRVIGNNQHLVRLDRELRKKISKENEKAIINSIKENNGFEGIIFGDYDKGTISKKIITEIINYSIKKRIPVYVDPKFENFFNYRNCTFFKPNKKETSAALIKEIISDSDLIKAGDELMKKITPENLLLTLGSKGMMLFENNGNVTLISTIARHIADVSGAGDTAIATLSVAIAGGADAINAAIIANYAAGAVCEMPGIVSINKEFLINAIKKSNNLSLRKIR